MAEKHMLEVLYFDGCPRHERLLAQLRTLIAERQLDTRIVLKRVDCAEAAKAQRFLGSPTVRVDGRTSIPRPRNAPTTASNVASTQATTA